MIHRELTTSLIEAAKEFPVVAILGPRQSGKTTLAQYVFKEHRYISFEDFDIRDVAHADPHRFLQDYPNKAGIILDEIQYVPHLLSYIQTIVDREKKMGYFIITGSQNLMVNQAISQSLAGRIALLTLLPLCISELESSRLLPDRIENAVYTGSYPRVYADNVSPQRLYTSYMRTYIERDVRQIKNIADLAVFQRFVGLCAGRTGQILNISSLGNDCGIDDKTARAWISLLEASYIIFLLQPYYKNFGKRLIKSPKLYFIDTGLACSLLRIKSAEELIEHSMRGPLVETFIIADLLKQQYNLERIPSLYFWRDHLGQEIDCIIHENPEPTPIEIKASKTVISSYFKELTNWRKITNFERSTGYVIYSGAENQKRPEATILSWKSIGNLIKSL